MVQDDRWSMIDDHHTHSRHLSWESWAQSLCMTNVSACWVQVERLALPSPKRQSLLHQPSTWWRLLSVILKESYCCTTSQNVISFMVNVMLIYSGNYLIIPRLNLECAKVCCSTRRTYVCRGPLSPWLQRMTVTLNLRNRISPNLEPSDFQLSDKHDADDDVDDDHHFFRGGYFNHQEEAFYTSEMQTLQHRYEVCGPRGE